MHIPHIYEPVELIPGETLSLTPQTSNHLTQSLRLRLNDSFRIFNGKGGEYEAVLIAIEKKAARIKVGSFFAIERESPLQIHLGQAVSRGEKMDYTLQKAVELGVHAITPLLTERCNVKLPAERWQKRIDHWRNVIIAACEQCGRNRLPSLAEPLTLEQWVQTAGGMKILLDPEGTTQLKQLTIANNSVSLLVGSEGGLSQREIEMAKHNNFINMQLGPRILRTETAALTVIAAFQSNWGDIG